MQDRILRTGHFLEGAWILGQGTIYPDTIESGGSAKADLIKTHHNRVAGIQKLIEEGRIVEPLTYFYKDEVREIGRELRGTRRISRSSSFPRSRPRDPVSVFARGVRLRPAGKRLDDSCQIGGRAGRLAKLSRRVVDQRRPSGRVGIDQPLRGD